MKKLITMVLACVLILSFNVTAFAATENIELRYLLGVDGNNSVSAKTGDIITVHYSIENTNENENAVTSTTQNQIKYDHTFFELVQDSVKETDGGNAFSVSTPIDSDGTHYIYFNSTSSVRLNKGTKTTIGEFKLKVIGTAGTSYVENTECFSTDRSGSLFASDKMDLAVTVAGDSLVSVTDIRLNKSAVNLESGDTESLMATISPGNATNRNIMWTSSDATVAAVDLNGVITAKNAGTATITAKTQDGGKTATCTVTVTKGDVFTVNASCGTGGTITPNGAQSVKKGEDLSFSFKANENYAIKDVLIDGVSNKAAVESGSYTFADMEENHTIEAVFERVGGQPENPFVDVMEGSYYYDAVLWAAENGITQGTDTKHFSPDVPVNRAQVVTFLWRAAGCPEPTDSAGKFTDVQAGSYYEKAVAWAVAQGITKGTSETTFSPDSICTRGQIVTFLARFAGVADANTASVFTDVKTTDYFAAAVKWAKDNKVTEGTSTTTFSPNQNCTRAQVVTFLYRWMVR